MSSNPSTEAPAPRVEAVYLAAVETFALPDGDSHTSALRKRPQPGPVRVEALGFVGDEQHDPAHGGPNRALHVFSSEHYRVFEALAGCPLEAPLVGENLTVSSFPDAVACAGDVVRVGSARLQVTMPTERCAYPGRNAGVPKLLKWMREERRTGYYLRVLEPGEIGPGDAWHLESRTSTAWSIEALTRAMVDRLGEADLIDEIEAMAEVAPEWKLRMRVLHERLAR